MCQVRSSKPGASSCQCSLSAARAQLHTALLLATQVLRPGGLLVVVCCHAGGDEETEAVRGMVSNLDTRGWTGGWLGGMATCACRGAERPFLWRRKVQTHVPGCVLHALSVRVLRAGVHQGCALAT